VRFLDARCRSDGASYWLSNAAEDGRFRLFSVQDVVAEGAAAPAAGGGGAGEEEGKAEDEDGWRRAGSAAPDGSAELTALLDPADGAPGLGAAELTRGTPDAEPGTGPAARHATVGVTLAHVATFCPGAGAMEPSEDPLRRRVDLALAEAGLAAAATADDAAGGSDHGTDAAPHAAVLRPAAPFVASIASLCLRAASKLGRRRYDGPAARAGPASPDAFDAPMCRSLYRRVLEVHLPLRLHEAGPAAERLGALLAIARAANELASLELDGHRHGTAGCMTSAGLAGAVGAAPGPAASSRSSSGAARRRRQRRRAAAAEAADIAASEGDRPRPELPAWLDVRRDMPAGAAGPRLATLGRALGMVTRAAAAAAAAAVVVVSSDTGDGAGGAAAQGGLPWAEGGEGASDADLRDAVRREWRCATGTAAHALLTTAKLHLVAPSGERAPGGDERRDLSLAAAAEAARGAAEAGAWSELTLPGATGRLSAAVALLRSAWHVPPPAAPDAAAPAAGDGRAVAPRGAAEAPAAALAFASELAAVRALLIGATGAEGGAVRPSLGERLVRGSGAALLAAASMQGVPRPASASLLHAALRLAVPEVRGARRPGPGSAMLLRLGAAQLLRACPREGPRGWAEASAEAWMGGAVLRETASLVACGRLTRAAEASKQAVAVFGACGARRAESIAKVALAAVVADASTGLAGEASLSSRLAARFERLDGGGGGGASGAALDSAPKHGAAAADPPAAGAEPDPPWHLGPGVDAALARCCRGLLQSLRGQGGPAEGDGGARVVLDRSRGIVSMLASAHDRLEASNCRPELLRWCAAACAPHRLLLGCGLAEMSAARFEAAASAPGGRRALLDDSAWRQLHEGEDAAEEAAAVLAGLGCPEAAADAGLVLARAAGARLSALQRAVDRVAPAADDPTGGSGGIVSRAPPSQRERLRRSHASTTAASLCELGSGAERRATRSLVRAWGALGASAAAALSEDRVTMAKLALLGETSRHLIAVATADLRVVPSERTAAVARAIVMAAATPRAALAVAELADAAGAPQFSESETRTGCTADGASLMALAASVVLASSASEILPADMSAGAGSAAEAAWAGVLRPMLVTGVRFLLAQLDVMETRGVGAPKALRARLRASLARGPGGLEGSRATFELLCADPGGWVVTQ